MLSGIFMAKCSVTTILFEYPPGVIPVGDDFSGVPYVPIIPVVSQCCSSPFLQLSHRIQLFTMQPTPALSPTLNLATFFPTVEYDCKKVFCIVKHSCCIIHTSDGLSHPHPTPRTPKHYFAHNHFF
jgi:hypothetical protein